MVEKIKKLCAERGISICALEKECGLANGTVARWDKVRPSVDRAAKVAAYFGISVETLIEEREKGTDL